MDSVPGTLSPSATPAPSSGGRPDGEAPTAAPGAPATGAEKRWTAILADFLERAGWSAGEQFLAVLISGTAVTSFVGLPWAAASVMAVGAAIISILTTAVEYASAPLRHPSFWVELTLRLVKTFASSLLGAMAGQAVFNFLHFGWVAALNLAAIATLGALAKGLLARNADGRPNASTLPVSTYNLARGANGA
jgi:hypothetical protein